MLVLLALVDANYKFEVIDVGSFSKEGDSGIFLKLILEQQINLFNFPKESALTGTKKYYSSLYLAIMFLGFINIF